MRVRLYIIVTLCLLSLPLTAAAREEGANAASLGVADAVRSSGVGTTALYFNPAAMHQFSSYTVETGYQFYSPTSGHIFTAGVVDSATNKNLAAGFSYSYVTGNELSTERRRSGHMIRGGLASGYRTQNFSVHGGVGVRYLDLTIGDDGQARGLTLDAGALLTLGGLFRLGVVGHNLINTELTETPRELGLGASLLWRNLLVSFDTTLDFESFDQTDAELAGGLEYAINGQVPLRVGYKYDRITGRQAITGGIGFVSRTVAADFGFSQNLDNSTDNIFSINVRLFVP